jgi:ABC-type bacteriocin/lantibiotic exporter with double-glycine peptidase domain
MSRWAFENGYRAEGNGSFLSLIPNGARHFGLTVEEAARSDAQMIVDALASGKLIIAIMSKGHFTSGGHFIVLRGVTADGKILVADPASKSRSEQEWDLSIILNEARKDTAAPFWILSGQP